MHFPLYLDLISDVFGLDADSTPLIMDLYVFSLYSDLVLDVFGLEADFVSDQEMHY